MVESEAGLSPTTGSYTAGARTRSQTEDRPGPLCSQVCLLDKSLCPECVKKQETALAAVENLRNLERSYELADMNPALLATRRISNCPFCSAPFAAGNKICPFCSSPYPETALSADIPLTKSERSIALQRHAEATYEVYAQMLEFIAEKSAERAKSKTPRFLHGIVDVFGDAASKSVHLTGQEIKEGADTYGVNYSEYIAGVQLGRYKTVVDMRLDEAEEKRKEKEKQSAENLAKNMEAIRAKSASSQQAPTLLGGYHTAPGYSGGAERCCGNCTYYGAGHCYCSGGPHEDRSVNASDHCGCWSLK